MVKIPVNPEVNKLFKNLKFPHKPIRIMLYYIGRVFGVFFNSTLPHSPKCPHKGLIYNCNLSKKWSVFFSLSSLTLFFIYSPILFLVYLLTPFEFHFIHVSTYQTVTTSNLNLNSAFFFKLMISNGKCISFIKFTNTRRFSKIDLFLQEFQSGMAREVLLIFTELVQVPCWTLRSVQK